MVDVVSRKKRAEMMAGIKSVNTKPEKAVRKHLHSLGFRYRIHKKIGRVTPDIILPKWDTCIFVNGCYWHRHKGCHLASTPKSNTKFWIDKFTDNTTRDIRNIDELNKQGWHVGVIWECCVRSGEYKRWNFTNLLSSKKNWEI